MACFKRSIWYNKDKMKIDLTEAEYSELKVMHKKTKDGRERDKLKTIVMLADGYTVKETARVLFLDEETICSWRDYFLNRKTINDWLGYKYVGYRGKLTSGTKTSKGLCVGERD